MENSIKETTIVITVYALSFGFLFILACVLFNTRMQNQQNELEKVQESIVRLHNRVVNLEHFTDTGEFDTEQ